MRFGLASCAALALLLGGCATAPPAPPSPMPADGRGRIVLRPFYLPSTGTNNAIAVFLGGGSQPIPIPLYDVTTDPVFLGVLHSRGAREIGPQETYEYDVGPGTRILMLRMRRFGGGDFVDFVEVPVSKNQATLVALPQYGMNDRPFFARLEMNGDAAQFCLDARTTPSDDIVKGLTAHGVKDAKLLSGYCKGLGVDRYRHVPSGSWEGPLTRERVVQLRDTYLAKWRALKDRTPPYDLDD